MSPFASFLLMLYSLALVSIVKGQDRAPHGIGHENPMAFSPSAYEFFHPRTQKSVTNNPCAISNCSPLPIALASEVEASKELETKALPQQKPRHGLGAGGVAAIVFGSAFVVLSAMGVFYVLNNRRANAMSKSNQHKTVQLDV